jgi:hypothetical protein
MALDHTMILGRYRSGVGSGSILKVQQGGSALVNLSQQYQSGIQMYNYVKSAFTANGRVYFPVGSRQVTQNGWWSYHQEKDEFFRCMYRPVDQRIIPFFDRVAFIDSSNQGYGNSPYDPVYKTSAVAMDANDHCIAEDRIHILYGSGGGTYNWQYPFNAGWVWHPNVAGGTNIWRLCELDDEVYSLYAVSGGTLRLYKLSFGSWVQVGGDHADTFTFFGYNTQFAFFKFNGKLFIALHQHSTNQRVKLWEIDKTTGVFTNRDSWLPAVWQLPNTSTNYGRIFEVRDDISNTEQVFLVRCDGIYTSGWEVYEFAEGPFSLVHSDVDVIYPYCGVIYDPDAKGADYRSAVDTIPSSYVNAQIEVFDIANNGTADIDPRYRLNGAEPPPYTQCTEKSGVGSEGVTSLSTKPAGITTLAHLSDDFADDIVDPDLWEQVMLGFANFNQDYGFGYNPVVPEFTVVETGGAIGFGPPTPPSISTQTGIGVKSKWWVQDAFSMRFTLANLANIRSYSSRRYCLVVVVRQDVEQLYGFIVWNNAGTFNIENFYGAIDTSPVASGVLATVLEGEVIEIARDGSDVWSITVDPDGTPTDITPVGANYSGPVNMTMGGYTTSSSSMSGATPDPGFSNLLVAGAGSLGRYEGGQQHLFAWDHISDIGAGVTAKAEMFVDVQRT